MRGDYFSKLSRAARWYLPPTEAAEVVEDYRDLIEEEPRSEEELRRDLGTPRSVAKQLARPKEYRCWLAVFLVLAVCATLPGITPLWQELSLDMFLLFRLYWLDIGGRVVPFTWVFFAVGMVLSSVWFRRRGGKKGRAVPKGILPFLVFLLAGIAWIWLFAWILLTEQWDILNRFASTLVRVSVVRLVLGTDIFAMGLIGVLGLVKARFGDRRWAAVYVLGLAGVILGLSVWAFLTSMNFDGFIPGWQIPFVVQYAFITLVGLVGTGVSLC